ncbi:hypothetical protein [Vibrio tapetis]|uniref:Uncharacterized protein n=1 Tax=Vibrio tapetis subsp. tapetis TaxID=1671868 RepID=A0A2N8ZJN1_9VIBR|nr:hypothetical protein [Vibrio tapetis]SON52123.1 conserved exported protein of unknown function [Vibrio tapetis subsp. tapetis]
MNKKILVIALASAMTSGFAVAEGVNAGIELEVKTRVGSAAGNADSGAKIFAGYEGFGASAKSNRNSDREYNLNYKHDFDGFYLKGEYEFVDKRTSNNQQKFGISAGTNVGGYFDTSLRLRKDLDTEHKADSNGKGDVNRFDFAVGRQFENVYLNTKVVGQKQNTASRVGSNAKDTIYNYEARLTFTNIHGFTPYFEAGNEASFDNSKRNTYGKVGVVFPF